MPDPVSPTTAVATPQGQVAVPGVSLTTPADGTPPVTPPGQTGSPDGKPTGSEGKVWYEGLVKDADNLKTMEAKKWGGLDDALKSYRELETKFSQGAKSQAPSDPKEYKFEVPDALKSTYSNEFAEGYRNWAHKRGLSQEQAAGLHDDVLAFSAQSMKAQSEAANAALTKSIVTAKTDLETAWGAETSPAFARNLEMSRRAISKLDPDFKGALKDAGIIVETQSGETITNSAVFKALAKVGAAMFAEDSIHGEVAENVNPFSEKTEDPAMQGRLIRENPEKAKLLIRAAGRETMFAHFLGQ